MTGIMSDKHTVAVVMDNPECLSLRRLSLHPLQAADVVVEVEWSGISSGTERLLWSGRMPQFPGMGYPLVPGYESVGRIVEAGAAARSRIGDYVFVPGATCFKEARGLFGGAARHLIVPGARAISIGDGIREQGILIALAATARHCINAENGPELIVGHGVLGRLLARSTTAAGFPPPTVWETNPCRRSGATGYRVLSPDTDVRTDYRVIVDVSGDVTILDSLIARLGRGGEIVLGGFYEKPLSFSYPPSFLKEARLRVAAEWTPADLDQTLAAIKDGRLSLDGLITHRMDVSQADQAYRTAFADPTCLKMILDWRKCA
ncbi:chlorophyll synthesis pathway protein BchC [Telmatospirillum siberiense]|nr:chlorophyll synthesis pathway protein BchC [Telmatospirillum siberiense]